LDDALEPVVKTLTAISEPKLERLRADLKSLGEHLDDVMAIDGAGQYARRDAALL
jgi:hypothetical protein